MPCRISRRNQTASNHHRQMNIAGNFSCRARGETNSEEINEWLFSPCYSLMIINHGKCRTAIRIQEPGLGHAVNRFQVDIVDHGHIVWYIWWRLGSNEASKSTLTLEEDVAVSHWEREESVASVNLLLKPVDRALWWDWFSASTNRLSRKGGVHVHGRCFVPLLVPSRFDGGFCHSDHHSDRQPIDRCTTLVRAVLGRRFSPAKAKSYRHCTSFDQFDRSDKLGGVELHRMGEESNQSQTTD